MLPATIHSKGGRKGGRCDTKGPGSQVPVHLFLTPTPAKKCKILDAAFMDKQGLGAVAGWIMSPQKRCSCQPLETLNEVLFGKGLPWYSQVISLQEMANAGTDDVMVEAETVGIQYQLRMAATIRAARGRHRSVSSSQAPCMHVHTHTPTNTQCQTSSLQNCETKRNKTKLLFLSHQYKGPCSDSPRKPKLGVSKPFPALLCPFPTKETGITWLGCVKVQRLPSCATAALCLWTAVVAGLRRPPRLLLHTAATAFADSFESRMWFVPTSPFPGTRM